MSTNDQAIAWLAHETVTELLGPPFNEMPYAEIDLKHRDIGNGPESHIEAWCREDADRDVRTLVLVINLLHARKEMQIPNILMPVPMSRQRLGKRVIKELFDVAQAYGYQLSVVDMVPSFHERLVNRGAVCLNDDSVRITADTNLLGAL